MINNIITAKWVDELEDIKDTIAQLTMKRLDVGYADNQTRWPYWVQPCNYSRKEWDKMGDWVVTTFGNGDWMTEHGLWVGSDRKYWFRNEADRTFFILRWS
jgi:hypothetical protein